MTDEDEDAMSEPDRGLPDETAPGESFDGVPPRRPAEFETVHPEPPKPLGGTLDAPEHPSSPGRLQLPHVPRPVKLVAYGLLVFAALDGLAWIGGSIGWRQGLVVISSVCLFAGAVQLRYVRPSPDFIEQAQRQQKQAGDAPTSTADLYRQQLGLRLFVGTSLCLVAVGGWAVAAWGG